MPKIGFDARATSERLHRIVFTAASGYDLEGVGPTQELYIVGSISTAAHEPFLEWLAAVAAATPEVASADVYRRSVTEVAI